MPSVKRQTTRLGLAAVCGLLLIGAASGCSTTQEKAQQKQAESKRILKARDERKQHKHEDEPGKQDEKGS